MAGSLVLVVVVCVLYITFYHQCDAHDIATLLSSRDSFNGCKQSLNFVATAEEMQKSFSLSEKDVRSTIREENFTPRSHGRRRSRRNRSNRNQNDRNRSDRDRSDRDRDRSDGDRDRKRGKKNNCDTHTENFEIVKYFEINRYEYECIAEVPISYCAGKCPDPSWEIVHPQNNQKYKNCDCCKPTFYSDISEEKLEFICEPLDNGCGVYSIKMKWRGRTARRCRCR